MVSAIEQEIANYGGIEQYLYAIKYKNLLRFLTCGSVDDGKSTLIGRLLHDSESIYDDQLTALYVDSKKMGSQKNKLDLALLIDGLESERTQGITIDVAYRYFFTKKRKFIIADTPGHEEYIRNMVTGASTSELAVLLVDARKGIREQTKRHWFISTLMGIKNIVVAINKMDLINYNQEVFQNINQEYLKFVEKSNIKNVSTKFIPISAIDGDNVIKSSRNMQWYFGPTLLGILEDVKINDVRSVSERELRFPVQYIIRNDVDFRGYSGTVTSGKVRVGQKVKIFPSNIVSVVKKIIASFDDSKILAGLNESITLILEDDVDVSRGDIILDVNSEINLVQFALVDVVWMKNEELMEGQHFNVKIATKIFRVRIENIRYQVDMCNFTYVNTNFISMNGVGLIEISFDVPLLLDQFSSYPATGSMIFIDIVTNRTVGAGMVRIPVIRRIKKNLMKQSKSYSKFELELHALIRHHFPHWNVRDLL